MSENIIESTMHWVQHKLVEAESGHDWWHISRVYKLAMRLAVKTGADPLVTALAALLHDLIDTKITNTPDLMEAEARAFLESLAVPADIISHIFFIIKHMSFRHANQFKGYKSIEFQVVQDADRLDAMGAIGIARAFSFGGYKRRPFLNYATRLEAEIALSTNPSDGSTIGHFYEKLLLLKDLMNTEAAREMAEQRHNFMIQWLETFFEEWEGKA